MLDFEVVFEGCWCVGYFGFGGWYGGIGCIVRRLRWCDGIVLVVNDVICLCELFFE